MSDTPDRYAEMLERMRVFLDRVAGSRPDDAMLEALGGDLGAWSERLAGVATDEAGQNAGNRLDLPSKGRFMVPATTLLSLDAEAVRATVRFGRCFLGGGDAAHGGSVTLVFDDLLGRLANHRAAARWRTAYLKTDFRAVTPLDVDLALHARVRHAEGRKRFLAGELRHGETLCASAEALFVELRPGQP